MKNVLIKQKLEDLKKDPKFNKEFVEILLAAYLNKEEGQQTANKIIGVIEKKYVETQKS